MQDDPFAHNPFDPCSENCGGCQEIACLAEGLDLQTRTTTARAYGTAADVAEDDANYDAWLAHRKELGPNGHKDPEV